MPLASEMDAVYDELVQRTLPWYHGRIADYDEIVGKKIPMVRILANGDIVPDDDPRAQQTRNRPTTHASQQQGRVNQNNHAEEGQAGVQQVSIFQALNRQLLSLGIPQMTFGDIVLEPIVSVGLVLALLLFGVQGLLFGALLFAVSRWSQNGAPRIVSSFFGSGNNQEDDRNRRQGGRGGVGGGGGGGGGGGYRLGRD